MKRHFNSSVTLETEEAMVRHYTETPSETMTSTAKAFGVKPSVARIAIMRAGVETKPRSEVQLRGYEITEKDRKRFMKKVSVASDDCWIWNAATLGAYGSFYVHPKVEAAHRASYMLFVGDIPEGLCVCYRCDTPKCVNPEHLFLGTHAQNMEDRNRKGRASGGSLKGELSPAVKFTEKDVLAMREMYTQGKSQREIARTFNTSQGYISNIVTRKTWGHV